MGGALSIFSSLLWSKKEIRILILGLVRKHDIHLASGTWPDDVRRIMPARQHCFTDSRYGSLTSRLVGCC